MLERIPLISARPALVEAVRAQLASEDRSRLIVLKDQARAAEHLGLEMPELAILDFADPSIDAFGLLTDISEDPWLLQGGIIAVYRAPEQGRRLLMDMADANIIVSLRESEIPRYLGQILRVIRNNRRLVMQRGLGADFFTNVEASFELGNDIIEARCYANLVCNFLYRAGRLDTSGKAAAQLAVTELLQNAIEHGNCGIGSKAKRDWLEQGRPIGELIAREAARPENREKRVTFEYALRADHAEFRIRDCGDGFDWRVLHDPAADEHLLALHGRGILMTRSVVTALEYNEQGNEVRFRLPYCPTERRPPALFRALRELSTAPGDRVFEQGAQGDVLYYIAKGEFEVTVDGRRVATLTPDDILIGEMSFLLNTDRNASVTATSEGKLIMISRQEFVEAIRVRPHYALLLARLLAQRIARLNVSRQGLA